MTISVYQVDSVIKAYNKHIKAKSGSINQRVADVNSCFRDCVTISSSPVDKAATFEKISYNIRDIIVKSAEE
jgi:hypothetical protein